MGMSPEALREQSLNAYNQWCEQWREHAKIHSTFEQLPLSDFIAIGVGKAVLCVANGRSFQDNIETIKKYQRNVDILCCDKTLGHLIDNGITPTYCMVCDANVNYEKYMQPWEDKLQDTILLCNVCGNPKWSSNGNWKKIYFFVNKDIILSEIEFAGLSGCRNFIPAGTNVSNAMIVLLTQSDDSGAKNYFGYDKILLTGYDYSWRSDEYYSFDDLGGGKNNYMRHITAIDGDGKCCYTSSNLYMSLQWAEKYISAFALPVVQCSNRTLLNSIRKGDLGEQMQYNFYREDSDKVRDKLKIRENLLRNLGQIDRALADLSRKHSYNFLATT